ncbi:MAG: efflux RND transporter permease subunit [Candidatus Omnitrophica bacterium]|nr:efflux RND transporter permease subunit [Candidatus Omnitrophota bacterium]
MVDKLIDFSLKNILMVVIIFIATCVGGKWAYDRLPIDAFPDVTPALVQVFTQTEGLAPEEIEQLVTYPVETAMNGLPDIEEIRSVSNFGLSVVNIYFKDGTDIYWARQLVSERLTEAREQIPEGMGEPEMGPIATGLGLILFYYLHDETGTRTPEEMRTIQDWIVKFNLQTVKGVTEVLGIGGEEKQYQVVIQPDKLRAYNLTLSEVIEAIRSNNLNVGAQFIEKGQEEYVIRSIGLIKNMDYLKNIVIKTFNDNTRIYLHQVADIEIGGAVRRGLETRNGIGEVVAGMVIKLMGANTSTVISNVEEKLKTINEALPKGIKIIPYYDQKTLVEACIRTVMEALIIGIILVILILLLFIGNIRGAIIVAGAIVFSVLSTFIMMNYFGISANLMSLGGLAIAIGMMVDAAVVMVENCDHHFRMADPQESKVKIIAEACREVARPIFFAIIIIIIVFLPLLSLQGVEGKTFRPLAITIMIAMFSSLLYALLFVPGLSVLIMKFKKSSSISFSERVINTIQGVYKPPLEYFVKHRKFTAIATIILAVLGALTFPFLGTEFTPELQEGTLVVRASMAPSISLNQSRDTSLLIEQQLMKFPEVVQVVSRVGRGEVGAHADPVNSSEMFVTLKPKEEWTTAKTQEELFEAFSEKLEIFPGVNLGFTQPIAMSIDELLEGIRSDLAIKIYGEDLGKLKEIADQVANVIKEVKGSADVQADQVSGSPQLVITPDPHKIARYGLSMEQVQSTIRAAIGGEIAGQVFEGVKRFDILVRYREEDRASKEDLARLLLSASNGVVVPLSQVAEIREVVGPRQITRENNQRFIVVQCNVRGRDMGSFVQEGQKAIQDKIKFPPGYIVEWGGQFELQQKANKRLAIVVPITLGLIFLLLYSSFNSLQKALLIVLNIPLALVGGLIALFISGENLSVPSSIGFIALFGIAVGNGLVLVSRISQLRLEGKEMMEAAIQGGCDRLRPVLMTALCTMIGLIPLVFSHGTGSEVQRPLAIVVIGGLISSTFLTLFAIPAFYGWFVKEEAVEF